MSEQNLVHLASPDNYIKCAMQTSVHSSVHLRMESCLLCIFHNTHWIRLNCAHLINQLEKVYPILIFFSKFQNLNVCRMFLLQFVGPTTWPLTYTPIITIAYDVTHDLDLGLWIFFTKQGYPWLICSHPDLVLSFFNFYQSDQMTT